MENIRSAKIKLYLYVVIINCMPESINAIFLDYKTKKVFDTKKCLFEKNLIYKSNLDLVWRINLITFRAHKENF